MATRQLLALVALSALATSAQVQQAPRITPPARAIDTLLRRFSEDPKHFTQIGGEALYRTTCQACHMEDGRGAQGAGAHPPLAGNPKLRSKHFVAGVILTGYHGMPRFGNQMSNEQVAAVTNYVRVHFGNDHVDPITPHQVAALRPPKGKD
jgi:mono/diheme cytochrome c family protein